MFVNEPPTTANPAPAFAADELGSEKLAAPGSRTPFWERNMGLPLVPLVAERQRTHFFPIIVKRICAVKCKVGAFGLIDRGQPREQHGQKLRCPVRKGFAHFLPDSSLAQRQRWKLSERLEWLMVKIEPSVA